MVRCEDCGAVLAERPLRRYRQPQPDGFWETLCESRCPYCESPYLAEFDPYGEEEAVCLPKSQRPA